MPLGDYETNGFVVWDADDSTRSCWIVDTGENPEPLLARVRHEELNPIAILYTHAHVDHIMGAGMVAGAYPKVPRLAHPLEHDWFRNPKSNLSEWSGNPITVPAPTGSLEDGQQLTLGSSKWRVAHTPGHSPGSIALVCETAPIALVGDTIFAGSIGRVDLPGADWHAFEVSLFDVLLALDDSVVIHPGHGPSTTIGIQRTTNPFLSKGRSHYRAMMGE